MDKHWFAVKTFYKRLGSVQKAFESSGYRTYVAMRVEEKYERGRLTYVEKPLIASLLFVECTAEYLKRFKREHESDMLFYSKAGSNEPAPIPDIEMRSFIILTTADRGRRVELLGESVPDFRRGEHVRVTAGVYAGAEGYIRRIRGDRKLLVAITGVAVIAVSYIHPAFLEKLNT